MGPDLFGREIVTDDGRQFGQVTMLQWGPTCSAGRSHLDGAAHLSGDVLLQWGPTCSAGRSSLHGPSCSTTRRGFNGARPVRPGDRRGWLGRGASSRCRFNGARPVRPGDRVVEPFAIGGDWMLQWGPTCSAGRSVAVSGAGDVAEDASMGPDLFGREIVRGLDPDRVHPKHASMGPDLFGREIACAAPACGSRCRELQWGPTCSAGRSSPDRALTIGWTELQWGPTCSAGRSGQGGREAVETRELQWGPTCSAGRSDGHLRLRGLLSQASMGPDLFGREIGQHGDEDREGPRARASMGPDLFGREIGGVRRARSPRPSRFNGARPVRSGDRP